MTEYVLPADPGAEPGTGLVLFAVPGALSRIGWLGPAQPGLDPTELRRTVGEQTTAASVHHTSGRALPVLPQSADHWPGQPGLRGFRLGQDIGRDWSPAFVQRDALVERHRIALLAEDPARGLALRTEFESVPGGAIRARHLLTNRAADRYVLEGLDVTMPVPDRVAELLDLTGRWGRERAPQRHPIRDGVWLREARTGRPGPESATLLGAGTAGFGFTSGEVWGVHLAWSGNGRYFVQRLDSGQTVLGAGELLLPGELVLDGGESYVTPWVFFTASTDGLDGLAEQLHGYLRSLPAHPGSPRPVVCNVWEAVYFDHRLDRLRTLADQAAAIGVERFVLDDGWFGGRRNDRAGLGDWTVSEAVWPDGLGPLIEHVRGLGMSFGLWFEPEMVNPDSELYRAHPDWVLAVPDRPALTMRNQLVLDLGRAELRDRLFDQLDALLTEYPIDFVKWDHNRPLIDGGSGNRHGAPGVHAQTVGFYDLLDRLRAAHPGVDWESCASGGARIDLGVLERAQRVWTSDMTDALARQQIQRWTGLLVPPEYLGAHISAPVNHQTGRQFGLDFRAGTAFFGDLGVEWDISSASPADRERLAEWIALYKQHRPLLHGSRTFRLDTGSDAYWIHGVVSADRSEAVLGYVQLDEAVPEPVPFRVPGLDPDRQYLATELAPAERAVHPGLPDYRWAGDGLQLSGAVLAGVGLPAPQRWPASVLLVHLQAR